MRFEIDEKAVVISQFSEEVAFKTETGPRAGTGIVQGSYGVVLNHGEGGEQDCVWIRFVKPNGIVALLHMEHLVGYYRCAGCDCCPGVYQCDTRLDHYCVGHYHKNGDCCSLLRPSLHAATVALIKIGERVILRSLPGVSFHLTAMDGRRLDPSEYPPLGASGKVADVQGHAVQVAFDHGIEDLICPKHLLEAAKGGRIRINDHRHVAIARCTKWALSRYPDRGLCWKCQESGRETDLGIRVEVNPEENAFTVVEECRKGHARILADGLDLGSFT